MEENMWPFHGFGCILRSVQPARFSSLTILGPKLLVACMRSVMSNTRKKNSQNKSCKRTGYMQGALCNKLLTIYATAKTGWEVNPHSVSFCLSVSLPLSLCASVSASRIFLFLSSSMLFKHRVKSNMCNVCIYACSWSTSPVSQI